jgi:hypothetical protein
MNFVLWQELAQVVCLNVELLGGGLHLLFSGGLTIDVPLGIVLLFLSIPFLWAPAMKFKL